MFNHIKPKKITSALLKECSVQTGIQNGFEQAISKMWKEFFHDKILNSPSEFFSQDVDPLLLDQFSKWACNRKKVKRYRYVFIVVNTKPGTRINDVLGPVKKTLNKVWVKEYMFSYEQRGNTIKDLGKGLHINFLFELTSKKSPWQCKQEVHNTFKSHVGNIKHVAHRYGNDPNNFINYIMGKKKDKSKLTLIDYDKRWRKKVGLQDYYNSPTFFAGSSQI